MTLMIMTLHTQDGDAMDEAMDGELSTVSHDSGVGIIDYGIHMSTGMVCDF